MICIWIWEFHNRKDAAQRLRQLNVQHFHAVTQLLRRHLQLFRCSGEGLLPGKDRADDGRLVFLQGLVQIDGIRPIQLPKKEGEKESEGKEESEGESEGEAAIKKGILKILKKRYDIEEGDLMSGELEAVPAGRPREAGLDQSMILGSLTSR